MQIFQLVFLAALGMIAGTILTSLEIPILKHKQFQQFIREEGPQSHLSKEGTPTMGGIAIFAALVLMTFIGGYVSTDTFVMLAVTLLFGLIGFFDDYIKVAKKHNLGLRAWQKLVLQILFAGALAVYMANYSGYGTEVWIPFIDKYIDFGALYIPFVIFVVVAMANAVNLTDGLDGLSSGVTALVAFFFAIVGMEFGHNSAAIFCTALTGACLGFLVFNRYPAKLFMGDTGSMALGGALASAAIIMKVEFLLPIAGLIYVLEALSVIIQVGYFKMTGGKRFFKMAPLHHHFEMCGMKEKYVVAMFWFIALVCCGIAYLVANI
ncbi:MAG: phospho-N-acetylmuramoyl-pentapeptide-transferase [Emergencia sp.]|jgi:phospho-N-acetylmuramoyl-pentapeptide-transferase|uniref:phospho-N-acetylmuramoyl-pentapeptide- transferase n=1 Tax=Emergencia sp. JLR.KK010 TaxID=3114296 RepID=UPI00216CA48B|nr:phospho-N-acetylmuramoyl-pentapeptide-transferase [Emergencia sp.]